MSPPPDPPLRHNFIDKRTPLPDELPAEEYNLNAVRTDAAYTAALEALAAIDEGLATAVEAYLAANPPTGETDLSVLRNATAVTVVSSSGDNATVPAADATSAGVMTTAMHNKLAGIAEAATANATDADLRDRSTHSGTQPVSSIEGFTEAVQDAVAALLAEGANVTLNYNDAGNTLTISATGGESGGLDAESVRDTIGVALVGVGNISVTVNDAADTITIVTTATVNATDAELRDRSTHSGQQAAATISDFAAAADARVTAGITGKLDTTAAPELIRDTIAATLVAGANITITPDDGADTITITATGSEGGGAPERWRTWTGDLDTGVGTWEARGSGTFSRYWVGGRVPDNFPTEWVDGDVWQPGRGDNINLGAVLDALAALTIGANQIPYFDADGDAVALDLKTSMPATPADTDILTAAATKAYVDKLPTQAAKTGNYTLQATDRNTCLEYNHASAAGVFTIANVFEANDVVAFRSINAGLLTIAAGSGVTLSVFGGAAFRLAGQWAEASIHFRTATHAVLTGNLIT